MQELEGAEFDGVGGVGLGQEADLAADLITKMELFGGDSKGLYMLNSELKARVYTAPSLVL